MPLKYLYAFGPCKVETSACFTAWNLTKVEVRVDGDEWLVQLSVTKNTTFESQE